MMAPSNSGPRPVLIVVGEKAFQMMLSQILVATIQINSLHGACAWTNLTEERNSAAQAVALLQQLVKQNDN